jgi:phage terminase Nu1 subunit (DNA packaging protein)
MMHIVPRTTLQLEDDAMRVAKAHAERHRLTLGQAVSELVRKAAERPLVTEERSGFRVLRLSRRSPKVTAARIDQLREDLP